MLKTKLRYPTLITDLTGILVLFCYNIISVGIIVNNSMYERIWLRLTFIVYFSLPLSCCLLTFIYFCYSNFIFILSFSLSFLIYFSVSRFPVFFCIISLFSSLLSDMLAGFNFSFIKQLLINKYPSLSVVSAADLIKAVRITAELLWSPTPDLPPIKSWGQAVLVTPLWRQSYCNAIGSSRI